MTQWLSAEEARKYLDLPSTTYLDNYAKAGELVEKHSEGKIMFSQEELDRWRKERKTLPSGYERLHEMPAFCCREPL